METKTKKTRKYAKKDEQSHPKCEITIESLSKAVRKAFIDIEGKIDARYLWGDSGLHRFRVNCWKDSTIHYSEFVYVEEELGELVVRREKNGKQ